MDSLLFFIELLPNALEFGIFLTALMAMALTPGPDMFYVMARGIEHGSKAGIASAFGISFGALIHTIAVAFGLSTLLFAVPFALDIIRWVGAAYLFYLAYHSFFPSSPVKQLDLKASRQKQSFSFIKFFYQGALTNILNPKVALFFLAFLPQFTDQDRGLISAQIIILGSMVVLSSVLVKTAVGIFSGRIGNWIQKNPRIWRLQQIISGSILAGLALKFILPSAEN